MTPDIWHYPRPELAGQYLEFFESGISNALILFQQRRHGKTEFCTQDLAPAAEASGYRVAYASFWQSSLSPTGVLLYTLEKALERKSFSDRLRDFFTSPVTKLKLSGELVGAKGEAEISLSELKGVPPADYLLYLDELFGRVAKRARGRFLLMIDEVQELAEDRKNASLVAALRTILDKNRSTVRIVFTGSSEEALRRMFSTEQAPFFHFGTRIELPALGKDFVHHIARAFKTATRRTLRIDEATAVFARLRRNPYYFRKLVEVLIATPNVTIDEALGMLRTQIAAEQGYPRLWERLKPVDRALVKLLAEGERSVFTKDTRVVLGKDMGDSLLDIAAVQTVLRRLVSEGIVRATGERGVYGLEDPELGEWARDIPDAR